MKFHVFNQTETTVLNLTMRVGSPKYLVESPEPLLFWVSSFHVLIAPALLSSYASSQSSVFQRTFGPTPTFVPRKRLLNQRALRSLVTRSPL